jgi:hypothetical protein
MPFLDKHGSFFHYRRHKEGGHKGIRSHNDEQQTRQLQDLAG